MDRRVALDVDSNFVLRFCAERPRQAGWMGPGGTRLQQVGFHRAEGAVSAHIQLARDLGHYYWRLEIVSLEQRLVLVGARQGVLLLRLLPARTLRRHHIKYSRYFIDALSLCGVTLRHQSNTA